MFWCVFVCIYGCDIRGYCCVIRYEREFFSQWYDFGFVVFIVLFCLEVVFSCVRDIFCIGKGFVCIVYEVVDVVVVYMGDDYFVDLICGIFCGFDLC